MTFLLRNVMSGCLACLQNMVDNYSMANWQGTVEMIRRVATTKGRQTSGFFSLEGIRLHERALNAGIFPHATILSHRFYHHPTPRQQKLLANLQATNTPIHIVPDGVLTDLTQGRGLGDILGLVRLPTPPNWGDILAKTAHPLILGAVDVVDPGNVGALLRTGHGLGIDAFVAIGKSDPFHPRAVRTSMGSLFKMPAFTYLTLNQFLPTCHQHHIETVGMVSQQGTLLPAFLPSKNGIALLMGGEYEGLSDEVCEQLDGLVTVEMNAGIDSFSVNAAAAIGLYEMRARLEGLEIRE